MTAEKETQQAITRPAPDADAAENRLIEPAAAVRLTYAEVEYLMSLCLSAPSSSSGNAAAGTSNDVLLNDALLGKLATAWRRHYRMS